MVDKDLSTEAADAIEMLLQDCQNEKRPSVQQIQEYMELADALREQADPYPEYDVPDEGMHVRDRDGIGPDLEVVSGVVGRAKDVCFNGVKTVAEENPRHPNDAPVVKVQYPNSDADYHFPVTRLRW